MFLKLINVLLAELLMCIVYISYQNNLHCIHNQNMMVLKEECADDTVDDAVVGAVDVVDVVDDDPVS